MQQMERQSKSNEWTDWPLSEQSEIDAMIDAYKKDDTTEDTKPPVIEMEENGSAESDDSADSDHQIENIQPTKNGNNQTDYYRGVREGLATCEFCGRVGIKHAFYSKSKRFCSLACSRSFSASAKENKGQRKGSTDTLFKAVQKYKTPQTLIQNKPDPACFDWSDYLNETQAAAAPVTFFRHSPMATGWDNISAGLKVEVLNTDCDVKNDVYWIATVIRLAGYRALMRYEGFGTDSSHDFWINLCIQDVHPVGWCATTGKPLVPPQTIQEKYVDWKDFLVKRLTGARTLPKDFYKKVQESLTKHPLKAGMCVEVVDRTCVSAMRVATVEEVIGGRLRLQYEDSKNGPGDEFWCHRESSLVHPMGWASLVGHKLHSTADYKTSSLNKIAFQTQGPTDSTPDMFVKTPESANGLKFQPGMKLEAIDPLNLVSICVATVMKVLRNNFLMIGIDGSMAESGQDWFCYHATSPCIFPVGFCEVNNIELTPPRGVDHDTVEPQYKHQDLFKRPGHKGSFNWYDYLKQTKAIAAPVKLFQKEIPKHGFRLGMKVEAVDLMEPRLICVGTIMKVVGRLLRIHFDGWESSYDQWVDCNSPDIYPVGWCEMVGYHLEGPKPRDAQAPLAQPIVSKKRKSRSAAYRGPRKKRKWGKGSSDKGSTVLNAIDVDEVSQESTTSTNDGSQPFGWSQVKPEPIEVSSGEPESMDGSLDGPPSDLPTLSPAAAAPGAQGGSQSATMPVLSDASVPEHADSAQMSRSASTSAVTTVIGHPISASTAKPITAPKGLNVMTAVLSLGSSQPQTATLVTAALPKASLITASPPAGHIAKLQTSPVYLATTSPTALSPDSKYIPQQNIPRVAPGEPDKDTVFTPHRKDKPITPEAWSVQDVCYFLRINDCGAHCDSFSKKNITGLKFMTLTKEQIVNLTGMKVGPSLKIYDLIQQLKITVAGQIQQSPPAGTAVQSSRSLTTLSSTVVITQAATPLHSPALKAQLTAATSLPMS